jgi:branched-subunit amino acid transport protein
MNTIAAIVLTGLGTYFSRAVFILALANRKLPPRVLSALQYVAPSVLAALVVTMLISPDGTPLIGVPEMAGLLVAGAVARASRNHLATLAAGMGIFWLARYLL